MQTLNKPMPNQRQQPLRAMIEIVDGELKIFPIADSDAEAAKIMDALRDFQEDFNA